MMTPPSKKEQALKALDRINGYATSHIEGLAIHDELVKDASFLRQLLEGLSDD